MSFLRRNLVSYTTPSSRKIRSIQKSNALNGHSVRFLESSVIPSTHLPVNSDIDNVSIEQKILGSASRSFTPKGKFKVYSIAEGKNTYGPREYHLLPLQIFGGGSSDVLGRGGRRRGGVVLSRKQINEFRVASLYANRNVLIGAWCQEPFSLVETCAPLVDKAMTHAEIHGEQVQALAALHGLCDWIAECTAQDGEGSAILSSFLRRRVEHGNNDVTNTLLPQFQSFGSNDTRASAIQALQNTVWHSEVGGKVQTVWDALIREFCEHPRVLAKEVELYRRKGAVLVDIIPKADESEEYMASGGGSMVRMYFAF
jgi:hypothetical protein